MTSHNINSWWPYIGVILVYLSIFGIVIAAIYFDDVDDDYYDYYDYDYYKKAKKGKTQ